MSAHSQDLGGSSEQIKKPVKHQQTNTASQKTQTGKPPQEAISSCADKEPNSQCVFQGPRTQENGYCEYTPDEQYFACKPSKRNE